MKKTLFWMTCFIVAPLLATGCASDRYNTQRGAAIGAALGAGYGQAIGRDTKSTLLGTALGGLAGAVIGNYEDQRLDGAQRHQYAPAYSPPPPPSYSPSARGGGNWVTVPGQTVSGYYVPPHQVWVQQPRRAVVVER